MDLTDEQWAILQPLIPDLPRRPDGKGRPGRDSRDVMNGILWILRTGAAWYDMADRYPPYQTCHRRFQQWIRSGVFERVLQALADDLRDRDLQQVQLRSDITNCIFLESLRLEYGISLILKILHRYFLYHKRNLDKLHKDGVGTHDYYKYKVSSNMIPGIDVFSSDYRNKYIDSKQ